MYSRLPETELCHGRNSDPSTFEGAARTPTSGHSHPDARRWFAPGTRTPWVVLQANQLEGVLAESQGASLLWENGISTLEAPPKATKISSGWVEPDEEGDLRCHNYFQCERSLTWFETGSRKPTENMHDYAMHIQRSLACISFFHGD